MNTGLTKEQMEDFISVFESTVSKTRAEIAEKILSEVLISKR
jgi:hypothetical protein